MVLSDKTILITGASSGIGRETAIMSSALGAITYIVGRNEDRLEETKEHSEGKSIPVICELTSEEGLDKLVESIPNIDGLVLCAGINEYIPVKSISKKRIDKIFDVNFYSQILLIQRLLKKKKLNRGASIVFISSIASQLGVPATLLYASSKSAINASARVLAVELAPHEIRVNVISPGIIKTEMLGNQNIDESQFVEQEKDYPLGIGSTKDVAGAVKYFLSDDSKWTTGANLILDGGFSLL